MTPKLLPLPAVLQIMAPKLCACCSTVHTPDSWATLPFVGVQVTPADEEGPEERLELRLCACGTTLAVDERAA